jgi:hypothetical protein
MSEHPGQSYTPAVLAAIRWLVAGGFVSTVDERALKMYYRRNGHLSGHASAGRKGAAGAMVVRLEQLGLVEDGVVTPAGREAAFNG